MQTINKFFPFINQLSKNVVITFHQKPDGDAFGSGLGLALFLKKLHHKVRVVCPTNWANFLHWMPGKQMVMDAEKYPENAEKYIQNADWIFCLDFNILSRTKSLEPIIIKSKAIKILIDHHEQPDTKSFDYGIGIPEKSSTCEMIYDFIIDLGLKKLIDKDIAICLYTGIMTDTGSFRFSNCSAKVHEVVAQLKKTAFDHSLIHQHIFDSYNENRLRFLGFLLSNRMVVKEELKSAAIYVTKEDLINFNINIGDTEGIVNYPLSLKNVEVVAFFVDRIEEIRVSLRSKKSVDVNNLARQYFNGGGHIMAAGGKSNEPVEKCVDIFFEAMAQLNTK